MTSLDPRSVCLLGPLALVGCGSLGAGESPAWIVAKIDDSVIDARALTVAGGFGPAINGKSFQQEMLVSHAGRQYVAYYDASRRVCLARRLLPDGPWQVIRFDDYAFASNDAHNTISLGICANDGTIHLAFDHHGHPLHYRASRPGVAAEPAAFEWDASLFGPIRSELELGRPIRLTYPRFWQTPDGGLQFCYRRGGSGNGDRMLVDYDHRTGAWTGTRQIDSGSGRFTDDLGSSDSRCSYPNGYHYGPDGVLHATWVWRESSGGANHDLVHAYSEDRGRTWRNSSGRAVDGPPRVDSPGLRVTAIPRSHGLMNTHGQAVDSRGRVHVVMWHCTAESLAAAGSAPGEHRWGPRDARRYHHYWRDERGAWRRRELPWVAGGRPKLFVDPDDNLVMIYRGADRERRRGPLVLAAATSRSSWRDWRVVHTEPGPFISEMLGDAARWQRSGVLSIPVQEAPALDHEPTRLRMVDFALRPVGPGA